MATITGYRATDAGADVFALHRQVHPFMQKWWADRWFPALNRAIAAANQTPGATWEQVLENELMFAVPIPQDLLDSPIPSLRPRALAALYAITDHLDRSLRRSFSSLSLGFEVMVFENGVPGDSSLVMVFGEPDSEIGEALCRAGILEPYSTSFTRDGEELSEQEREIRRQAWVNVINAVAPSEVGVSLTRTPTLFGAQLLDRPAPKS